MLRVGVCAVDFNVNQKKKLRRDVILSHILAGSYAALDGKNVDKCVHNVEDDESKAKFLCVKKSILKLSMSHLISSHTQQNPASSLPLCSFPIFHNSLWLTLLEDSIHFSNG